MLVCLRADRPINLVSAYERPIRSSEGYVMESVKQLKNEYESVMQWVDKPLFSFSLGMDDFEGNQRDLQQLLKELEESLNTLLDS